MTSPTVLACPRSSGRSKIECTTPGLSRANRVIKRSIILVTYQLFYRRRDISPKSDKTDIAPSTRLIWRISSAGVASVRRCTLSCPVLKIKCVPSTVYAIAVYGPQRSAEAPHLRARLDTSHRLIKINSHTSPHDTTLGFLGQIQTFLPKRHDNPRTCLKLTYQTNHVPSGQSPTIPTIPTTLYLSKQILTTTPLSEQVQPVPTELSISIPSRRPRTYQDSTPHSVLS
jgi:hypothetical protein